MTADRTADNGRLDSGPLVDAGGRKVTRIKPGSEAPAGIPGTGEATCPVCGGSGRIDGQPCPHCDGTGVIDAGIGGG